MCGRFTLKTPAAALAEHFEVPGFADLLPRYNVAPSQPVAVIRPAADRPGREAVMLRWGLIPAWADDPAIGYKMINARAETVADKPAYRSAFKKRRCLIPADSFYEWAKSGKHKQPWNFALPDGGPFAFAGLWETWSKGDGPVESCTLVTTEANGTVAPVHARMPVILLPEEYGRWLDAGNQDPAKLMPLLRPYPGPMVARAVGAWVNDPKHEGPRCVEPAG